MGGELTLSFPLIVHGRIWLIKSNTTLKQHYDKLLHVLGTFTVMCFLCVWIPWNVAIAIVLFLQAGKAYWNFQADNLYHPAGDMLANVIGYGLYWLYVGIQ